MRQVLIIVGVLFATFVSNAFCDDINPSSAHTSGRVRFVNTADSDVQLGVIRKSEVYNYDGAYRPAFETARLSYNPSNSDYFVSVGTSNDRKPTVGFTLGITW